MESQQPTLFQTSPSTERSEIMVKLAISVEIGIAVFASSR